MKHYENFGFGYISPNGPQRAMVNDFQVAGRSALTHLAEIQEQGLLVKNAPLDYHDGVSTAAQRHVNGQTVIGFMAAAHQTTHLAFADVGLFRNGEQYRNPRFPKIEDLCYSITALGEKTLDLLGLTQPLTLEDAQELYPEGAPLPSATVGLMRYIGHSIRRREGGNVPRAFINISDQPQTWNIGFGDIAQRKTLVQERGGIVVYESRPDKTQNPNPYYVVETEGVGVQLMVSTTQDGEFDKHFGLI